MLTMGKERGKEDTWEGKNESSRVEEYTSSR